MKIYNVRMGFATNSSSSHSILLNCETEEFSNEDGWQYGWGDFLLNTPDSKARYMLVQLYDNLENSIPEQTNNNFNILMHAAEIVKELGFDYTAELSEEFDPRDRWFDLGVDHQSVLRLPTEYNSAKLSMDFFRDFFKYVVNNEDLAIAGGNDNDDSYDYGGVRHPISQLMEYHRCSCRQDGDIWTLFNSEDGNRLTFNFHA